MRRILLTTAAAAGLLIVVAVISNLPVQGQNNVNSNDLNLEYQREQLIGFAVAPVRLNLQGKDPAMVGLGSYIVNAHGGCNDCHTCPSYKPGHNPFPPPFGVRGDGQFNDVGYLAGGVSFGSVISANLTPDFTGKPRGFTLDQFKFALRTGHDPIDQHALAVMPWPVFRFMTDRDLDAIYAYLSAIPSATPPPPGMGCTSAGE
ncbi:MAG: cytochrome C [Verrucomicrobia bacterium]|nr:cytochrome C [Verrucomicrobiota bacterium]